MAKRKDHEPTDAPDIDEDDDEDEEDPEITSALVYKIFSLDTFYYLVQHLQTI